MENLQNYPALFLRFFSSIYFYFCFFTYSQPPARFRDACPRRSLSSRSRGRSGTAVTNGAVCREQLERSLSAERATSDRSAAGIARPAADPCGSAAVAATGSPYESAS